MARSPRGRERAGEHRHRPRRRGHRAAGQPQPGHGIVLEKQGEVEPGVNQSQAAQGVEKGEMPPARVTPQWPGNLPDEQQQKANVAEGGWNDADLAAQGIGQPSAKPQDE